MKKNKISCLFMIMICNALLIGCKAMPENAEAHDEESHSIGQDLNNDIECYQKVNTYMNCYQEEVEEIKHMDYTRFSFEACNFEKWGDVDVVYGLELREDSLSAEDSLEMIEIWLEETDLDEKIDLEKELRDASGQLERDDTKNYPYDYPSVYENKKNLTWGSGFFINTNLCYLQMGNYGYMQMSNGKINTYLGSDSLAAMDALGINEEEVIETGTIEEMENKTYTLLDGEMSVKDGAELAVAYFETGTPNPPAQGISIGVSEVSVFKIKDIYGFAFKMYRSYKGVPISNAFYNARTYFSTDYGIQEDEKTAYLIDSEGVSAFLGYCEAQEVIETEQHDVFIGLKDAISLLHTKLANNLMLNIENVEFVYCPLQQENGNKIARPCWMLRGTNINNGKGIMIYIDSITSDLYYYEYIKEAE